MGLGNKLLWLYRHFKLFSTPADIRRYRRAKNASSGEPVVLRIRALGGHAVLCRPGTTDALVLWDTFGGMYHLPPMKLRENAVILDLGANVGYTAAHFATLYPNARVIAVEMDAANARMAHLNTLTFPRCTIGEAAVCAEAGEVRYGDAGDGEWAYTVGAGTKTARAVTIADLIEQFRLDRIDYLKMDIEGAEDGIFKSDLSWLDRVGSLNMEVHDPADINAIQGILESRGFRCWRHGRHSSLLLAVK